ncbi:MAG TPA: RNA polymerase sigma factor [Hyphomicrobiaceae bacterium]|nr:RNA polymerase sigma factor [Hyphomicrobiaceae bacterium]
MTDQIRAEMIRLLPRLRRFAHALTGARDQGDDLVQETCVRALTHIDQWEPGTRLDSWMFRIAQNLWLDSGRAQKVRGEKVDLEEAYDVVGSDGRQVTEQRMALEAVREGLQQLPPEQRVLVALVCIDGLSYKETAAIVDAPIGTVMSRLARARRALHEYLNREVAPQSKDERRHERNLR